MADRNEVFDSMSLECRMNRIRNNVHVTKRATLSFTRAEMNREEWDTFQTIQDEIRAEFLAQ